MSPKPTMDVGGESDGRIVPMKGSNKDGQPSAEGLEGRGPTKENIEQPTPLRTQSRASESSGLFGVREVTRKDRRAQFTALLHPVTVARLQESSTRSSERLRLESMARRGVSTRRTCC